LLTRSLMATARFFSRVSRLKRDICIGTLKVRGLVANENLSGSVTRPMLHFNTRQLFHRV